MQLLAARAGAVSAHARDKYLPAVSEAGGRRTALCLSGAGFRAALFNAGAIRRLNELGLLSRIASVSCTGGGGVVGAALAVQWRNLRADPNGVFYNLEDLVVRPVERLCAQRPRLGLMFWARLRPSTWAKLSRYEHNNADLLADYLDRRLLRGMPLRETPSEPTFVFSAVNARTGGQWEFRRDGVGEILLGYAPPRKLRLAEAVAASMVDPVHHPCLILRFDPEEFENGALGPKADPLREVALLSSGSGVDPLAVEAVWRTHGALICCDGGRRSQLTPHFRDGVNRRVQRMLDLSADHAVEMQKRWLIGAYAAGQRQGMYIGLSAYHGHYSLPGSIGYPADVVEEIRQLPNEMMKFEQAEIMLLANHGYTLADTAVRRYWSGALAADVAQNLPYPEFVDRTRILSMLGDVNAHAKRRAA